MQKRWKRSCVDQDGLLYDDFLYLYVNPKILKERMRNSERNNKYLEFDIEKWQKNEVESLRAYCHEHNKDFYVLDEPLEGAFLDISPVLEFIDRIAGGFSCVQYAKQITERILRDYSGDEVTLFDGDKTLIFEDSCGFIGYKTHLFDGNFYSGFQFFRHHKSMADYVQHIGYSNRRSDDVELHINPKVIRQIRGRAFILTSGYPGIWKRISEKLHMSIYCGEQMSADTKYYVTKFLQQEGIRVTAFGDSMNDYYMLKQADESHLILRQDGTVSTSLKERNLEEITIG